MLFSDFGKDLVWNNKNELNNFDRKNMVKIVQRVPRR